MDGEAPYDLQLFSKQRNSARDEMSYGPDAVGSDAYYCDMSTRELSPLCTSQDVEGCVNVDAPNNRITKRSSVAKRSANLVFRSYEMLDMHLR